MMNKSQLTVQFHDCPCNSTAVLTARWHVELSSVPTAHDPDLRKLFLVSYPSLSQAHLIILGFALLHLPAITVLTALTHLPPLSW